MLSARSAAVTALLALAITACDTPVRPSDHAEAGGFVILDASSGAVIAMSVGELEPFDAQLTLNTGQTREVEILLLDADAPADLDRAFLPDEDEGLSLRITSGNTGVATYASHGDHGDITGVAAGTTTLTVELRHGGHADFTSGPLTVVVQ